MVFSAFFICLSVQIDGRSPESGIIVHAVEEQ